MTNLAPACPSSGTPASSDAIQGGGTHTYYTFATTDYASLVTTATTALTAAGWTVASTGNSGYGQYGGGGSTVTKGVRYATFDVGSSGTRTYMDVCVWPTKPANTNCGQNSNSNGNDNEQPEQPAATTTTTTTTIRTARTTRTESWQAPPFRRTAASWWSGPASIR